MTRPFVFIDHDGVINDGHAMGEQYVRILARTLAKEFGGQPGDWDEGNRAAYIAWSDSYRTFARSSPTGGYRHWLRRAEIEWVHAMFRAAGQPLLPEGTAFRLAERLGHEIPSQICTLIDGAGDAVRTLKGRGYRLVTASGGHSLHVRGALTGSGLIDCFHAIVGPDTIDCPKESPQFYRRLFRQVGAEPEESIVVDDLDVAIRWAAKAGARTIYVGRRRQPAPQPDVSIGSISELPDAVCGLSSHC